MPARRSGASKRATAASKKTHKRQLSQVAPSVSPGSRASKRLKESAEKERSHGKATPTKSKYFQNPDSEDEDADLVEDGDEDEESGYEDQDTSETEQPLTEESGTEDDYDSDEDNKRKRRQKKASKKSSGITTGIQSAANAVLDKGKELWRPGVKTGLGPGKQVFIEKPKPRDDGGIKYVDGKIHPNTMAFLKDLKENNDREWLKIHEVDYRASWKDWESFVETLTEGIIEIDETIPELPPKDLVFRIYRDIRFSSDPTPYKPHFSAAWSRTGRKGPYACYYVQIQPGGRSFVGSGLWMPESQPLALLRANIDRKPKKLRRVLTEAQLRKEVLGVTASDEKKAIKAFADQNKENALKTKPKLATLNTTLVKPVKAKGQTCLNDKLDKRYRAVQMFHPSKRIVCFDVSAADLKAPDAATRVSITVNARSWD
ncbi:uncharacterized protein A1O5_04434 [Cladophialophora psammophila CBS 110553]|uniref:Uncharacterized protein n=1 Tax=Cladophialophora psammophila CBS 110553 TaxID=1182543 RepID=W9WVI1_9EURO|nr:uncharacterized protein A1O5_04434 [Cladophialophora psammophila CBS 110553]EXJ71933.1 hypothetical protein A1O5_04434 [Cladophialophora psammophila CBS 110553]